MERIVFPISAAGAYIQDDLKRAEHVLTCYFVRDIEQELPNLPLSKEQITDSVQTTFGTIQVGEERCLVARYWREVDVQKLLDILDLRRSVAIDPKGTPDIITAFVEDHDYPFEFV